MPFAELEEEFLAGFVVDSGQGLQCEILGGFEAGFGHFGPADDVGVRGEAFHDLGGDGGTTKAGVVHADAGGALQTQAVEIVGELFVVAVACAAEDEVGEDGGSAVAIDGVGGGAGGDQEGHRGRLHAGHFFGQEGEAVLKRMLVISFRQLRTPVVVSSVV